MAPQAPRGTRDFYPAEMARLNHLFDAWRRVSLRNGFEQIDGPAFEHLELYTAKSGDEIVGQLFRMTDRGGRELALRPELTPTLARMVNQRASSLRLPIKWFSMPRFWRAERPQRGRLREFFQWNIDVVGSDEPIADAEVIYAAVDLLRELGLTPDDIVVKLSSRSLLAALLADLGVPDDRLALLYAAIDKKTKMESGKFAAVVADALGESRALAEPIIELTACTDLDTLAAPDQASQAEKAKLQVLFELLADLGSADWCAFDLGVVRGLAYYTGPVFEIYDRGAKMRAICGGGRYDDLLSVLGGPKMPAVGFGMGDVVLADLLEAKGLWPESAPGVDYFLIDADASLFGRLLGLADALRRRGASATFSYRRVSVSKQFKQAAQANAARAVVVGQELADGRVAVKELASGRQVTIAVDDLLSDPSRPIPLGE